VRRVERNFSGSDGPVNQCLALERSGFQRLFERKATLISTPGSKKNLKPRGRDCRRGIEFLEKGSENCVVRLPSDHVCPSHMHQTQATSKMIS
jgi:hypothetical protein